MLLAFAIETPFWKVIYRGLFPASTRLVLYPHLIAAAHVLLSPLLYGVIAVGFFFECLILAPRTQKISVTEIFQHFVWFVANSLLLAAIITIYLSLHNDYLQLFEVDGVDGMATWPVAGIVAITTARLILDALVTGTAFFALAKILPRSIDWIFKRLEHQIYLIGRRRVLAVTLIIVLAVGVRVTLLRLIPIPEPKEHDDFSYLLAADTFASGRLTNPAHPMWVHFESFHINQTPTYQSKYPVGQGLILGLAQKLTGNPWIGVLFGIAFMCAAICWMLQGWLPPGWAFLGALLCVLKYCGNHYWMNSYYGGAIAGIGGALVLGAWPRIIRKFRVRDSLILGIGVAILANSRPYEGLILTVAVAIALWVACVRKNPGMNVLFKRLLLPASLPLLLAAAGMMFYFWRVTQNPLLMPYELNSRQYSAAPIFIWQKLQPTPRYNHEVMREFYLSYEAKMWCLSRTVGGLVTITVEKVMIYYAEFVWPLVILFLLGSYYLAKKRHHRYIPIVLSVFLLGLLGETWGHGQYAAPVTALVAATVLFGLRYIRSWSRGTRLGMRLSRVALLLLILLFVQDVYSFTQFFPEPWQNARTRIQNQLEHMPGQHLVIVRYVVWHNFHEEWVYNAADIDHSRVLFARDMGPQRNQEVLEYFKGRQFWLVNADELIRRVEPYEKSSADWVLLGGPSSGVNSQN